MNDMNWMNKGGLKIMTPDRLIFVCFLCLVDFFLFQKKIQMFRMK
jgi:hypothetical protein